MGVVAGAFAIFVAPLVLGPFGVLCGIVAVSRGERRGWWVMGLAFVGLGLGLLVNHLPAENV